MLSERRLAGREHSKPEPSADQRIRTLCLSESNKREIEAYVGVGEHIAEMYRVTFGRVKTPA